MEIHYNPEHFMRALKTVAPFMSVDPTRAHLMCTHFEWNARAVVLVATDGYTLASVEMPKCGGVESTGSGTCNIRSADVEALVALRRLTSLTLIDGSAERVTFRHGLSRIVCEGDRGPFAPWRERTPTYREKADNGIHIDPRFLLRASKACDTWLRGAGRMIALSGDTVYDPLRLDAEHPDIGKLTVLVMPAR